MYKDSLFISLAIAIRTLQIRNKTLQIANPVPCNAGTPEALIIAMINSEKPI